MKTFLLCLLLAVYSTTAHSQTHFVAFLESTEEDPTFMIPGHGYGHFILSADSSELRYIMRIWKTSDTASAAHFHLGDRRVSGNPVRFIRMHGGLVAMGTWRRSDATESFADTIVEHLFAGRIYVNIHTQNNPGGEIRGQVFIPKARIAIGNTAQEVPTPAAGDTGLAVGIFVESEQDSLLYYRATAGGLSSPSRFAHIHFGSVGSAGPVVAPTTIDTTINTATGYWTSEVTPGGFADHRQDYLRDSLYWNIHTVNNLPGELRGQIIDPLANGASAVFTALLTANDEGIASAAEGTAVMLLSPDQRTLTIQAAASGLTSPLFLAHIHDGNVLENGEPVVTVGATAYGVNQVWTGLTPQDVENLFNGEYYLNLHTTQYPNGEIRGQIFPLSQPTTQSTVKTSLLESSVRLYQNAPNPVVARTEISYYLPSMLPVKLSLVDQLGREVRLLEYGIRHSGDHSMMLNADDLPP
jgi:hypothetical protein